MMWLTRCSARAWTPCPQSSSPTSRNPRFVTVAHSTPAASRASALCCGTRSPTRRTEPPAAAARAAEAHPGRSIPGRRGGPGAGRSPPSRPPGGGSAAPPPPQDRAARCPRCRRCHRRARGRGPETEARPCRVTPGVARSGPARSPVRAGRPRSSRGAAAAPAPARAPDRPLPRAVGQAAPAPSGARHRAAAGGSLGEGEADPDTALGHSSAGRPPAPHSCPPWPRGPGRRC